MGFYVDGELVNIKGAYTGSAFPPYRGVTCGIVDKKTIYIFGVKESKYSIVFNIPIDSLNSKNEYRLERSLAGSDEASITDDAPLGGNHYVTTPEHDGMIKFSRYDDKVIAGTFEFDAYSKNNGKVISVTEGRFDIKR